MRLTVRRQGEGRAREGGGTGRDTGGNKRSGGRAARSDGGERLIHRLGVGTCFTHRTEIEVEMRDATTTRVDIGFFAADDFIDQEAHLGITDGHPWNGYASQVTLQPLQQRHEIPDRENMRTHEHADVVE